MEHTPLSQRSEVLLAWPQYPEARRGSQGASRAAPGKPGLHARGEGWLLNHISFNFHIHKTMIGLQPVFRKEVNSCAPQDEAGLTRKFEM